MAEERKPIPVPPARRWREFRIRVLPVVVFLCVAGAVAMLWQTHVAPAHMTGLVVADVYELRSPRDGVVHQMNKDRFDPVSANETVLTLYPAHTERIQAELDVIRAEVELIRAGLDPVTGRQRAQLSYEELRLDMMNARIQLAADRLQRDHLRREQVRTEQLYDRHLLATAEYDRLITDLEIYDVKVREGEIVLAELAERLHRLAGLWDDDASYETALQAAITVKEKELSVLETDLTPVPLTAPAGGIVAEIRRRNGEYVTTGEPILRIQQREPTYVVGYLRQPISRVPEHGTNVRVYSKSLNAEYEGVITRIGYQLEPIHEVLLRPGITVEYALPIRIHVDTDVPMLPGEIVDIRM